MFTNNNSSYLSTQRSNSIGKNVCHGFQFFERGDIISRMIPLSKKYTVTVPYQYIK